MMHSRPLAAALVALLALLAPLQTRCSPSAAEAAAATPDMLAAGLGVSTARLLAASRMTRSSPAKVASLLRRDRSAFLSRTGAVSYGCHLNSPDDPMMDAADHSPVGTSTAAAGLPSELLEVDAAFSEAADPGKAFQLHSRPGARRCIFLQFQGCKTTGTDWNDNFELDKIVTPPYDSDGRPGFSDEERLEITTIWKGVAEHFSLWEVDVTTEDPGFDALERSSTADADYGMRMCVGGNSSWTRSSIGGIATTWSFGWVNTPGGHIHRDSFVFSQSLVDKSGLINLGYVWKSITHELGHTLGLGHDGVIKGLSRQEYYIPNGPTLWVPVMGVPGNGLFAQWSNGSYPPGVGAPTNTEDDIAIISQSLLPLPNQPGLTARSPRVLCSHVPCVKSESTQGAVIASVQASMSGSAQQHFYSFTADSTAVPAVVSITYKPNWLKTFTKPGGSTFYNNWRLSMMRLKLAFEQPGVAVEASPVNQLSTRQVFTIRLPAPGTYTFSLSPWLALDSSNASAALPTLYGNAGRYQLVALFPSSKPPAAVPNQPPVAVADAFETPFNTTLPGLNLTANDEDADGDSLEVVATTAPQHGTLEQGVDGLLVYLPWDAASNVTDAFTYTVVDGRGGASTGSVEVRIGPQPPQKNGSTTTSVVARADGGQ